MGVDVDQPRSNDLAARIDRLGGVARDVGLDRDDLAGSLVLKAPITGMASSPTEGSMTRPPLIRRS